MTRARASDAPTWETPCGPSMKLTAAGGKAAASAATLESRRKSRRSPLVRKAGNLQVPFLRLAATAAATWARPETGPASAAVGSTNTPVRAVKLRTGVEATTDLLAGKDFRARGALDQAGPIRDPRRTGAQARHRTA